MSLRFLTPLLLSTALMAQFPGGPMQPPGMEHIQEAMAAQRRQLRQAMAQHKAAKANQEQKTGSVETGINLARLPKPQSIVWRFEPGRSNVSGAAKQTAPATTRNDAKPISTMAYIPASDGKHLVVTLDKPQRICGLDPASGKTLWETPFEGTLEFPPILLGSQAVMATSDYNLILIDAESGKIQHRIQLPKFDRFVLSGKKENPKVYIPVLEQGRLFVATYGKGKNGFAEGRLIALNPQSGQIHWDIPLSAGISMSPEVTESLVLIGGGGSCRAVDIQTGKQVWEYKLPDSVDFEASPIIENRIYLKHVKTLTSTIYALDVRNGKCLWEASHSPATMIEGENGKIIFMAYGFFAGSKHSVTCLDATTGKTLWQHKLSLFYQHPWLQEGRIYCNAKKELRVLDLTTGELKWSLELESEPSLPLLPVEDTLYAACHSKDGRKTLIRALDITNGKPRWEYVLAESNDEGMLLLDEQGMLLPGDRGSLLRLK